MAKKKFLSVLLPIFGSIAIVGSGFSTWYFTEDINQTTGEGFGLSITDARQSGQTFSFGSESEKEITLDQKGVSYAEGTYVCFGYVAEAEGKNNENDFDVAFLKEKGSDEPGVKVEWQANEGAMSLSSDISINEIEPSVEEFEFTVTDNGKSYHMVCYYILLSNLDENGATLSDEAKNTIKSQMDSAIENLNLLVSDNSRIDMTDKVDLDKVDYVTQSLPTLEYTGAFNENNIEHYNHLVGLFENNQLTFSTYVDVTVPNN